MKGLEASTDTCACSVGSGVPLGQPVWSVRRQDSLMRVITIQGRVVAQASLAAVEVQREIRFCRYHLDA